MTEPESKDVIEMPAPTAWPLVMSVGVVLMGMSLAMSLGFLVAGVIVFVFGLGGWIAQLLPGRGHMHEALASSRPTPPAPAPGTVESLVPGTPGFRFRLPAHVHPISSGAKGGLIGAILMAIPAVAYGIIDEQSPWLPINLLAGVVFPGVVSHEQLREFHLFAFVLASVIHFAFSITFGLMYGVLLPMLPPLRGGWLLYGGVLMPMLWSGVCYGLMGVVNPLLEQHVNWKWFILSQFVYGLTMSYVVHRSEKVAVSQAPPLKGDSWPGVTS